MTRTLAITASICMAFVANAGTVSAATSSCTLEAVTPTAATANDLNEYTFTIRNPTGQADPIRLVRIHAVPGGYETFTFQASNVAPANWTTYVTGDGADFVALPGAEIAPGDSYDFAISYTAPGANGNYAWQVTAGDNPNGGDITCTGSDGDNPLYTQVTGGSDGGGTTPDTGDLTPRDIKIASLFLATFIAVKFISLFRFRRMQ